MSLLNRKETRRFILGKCERLRPHLGIERVSGESLDKIEAKLRQWLIREVQSHPSRGKTFKL